MVSSLPLECLVEKLESLIASVYSEDPDGKKLCLAVNDLDKAAQDNFAGFMHSMSVILANYGKYSISARRGAALQLKQRLTNKDPQFRDDLRKRWLSIPSEIRNEVKNNALQALQATQGSRPNNCSQVVAYLASVELPITDNWPRLIPSLCQMVLHNQEEEKEGPIEALAFVCKELSLESLAVYASDINVAVLTCFKITRSSDCTRLAALICLLECYDFTKILIANDITFPVIMANICHSARSLCSEIRVGGLAALVKIARHQYACLKEVIDEVEAQITIEAIKSNHRRTHIQALEFWKAVSQSETPRDSDGRLINERGYVYRYGFSERALEKLVPALLYVLKRGDFVKSIPLRTTRHRRNSSEAENSKAISNEWKHKDLVSHGKHRGRDRKFVMQNEYVIKDEEEKQSTVLKANDNWIPPKEVIIYLSELCESFPMAIDMHILPRFPASVQHEDWRERNGALWSMLVFLQQMKASHAQEVLPAYVQLILNAVQDKTSPRIRNTALWVLSWMLDKCPWLVVSIEEKYLRKVVNLLLACLSDEEGRVAPTSCITITSLVKASYVLCTDETSTNMKPQTFHLSPCFDQIADCLLQATKRRLTASFEALRQILIMAPDDCYWVVLDTFDALLIQLREMISLPELHPVGCDCHETLQQILCAVLRSVFKTLRRDEEPTVQLARKLMDCAKDIVKLFPHGRAKADATLAASAIVSVLGWQVSDHPSRDIPHISSVLSPMSDIDNKTYNL